MIYQFVKDKHGHRKGVVVALDKGKVGWSLCNPRDRFDKGIALDIALGRATKRRCQLVPPSVDKVVASMEKRSVRYFK